MSNGVDEYKNILKKIKILKDILPKTHSSLILRKELKKITGSKKNVNIINMYLNKSYITICESLRVQILLNLSLFNDSTSKINITKLIDSIESSKKHLNKENFKKIYSDRVFIEELTESFEKINNQDIELYRSINNEYSLFKEQIKDYRNKFIAHNDFSDTNKEEITVENIENYLKSIEKLFNIIYKKLTFSTTNHDFFKENIEITNVLGILNDYEKDRLIKIQENTKIKLDEYKKRNLDN